MLTPVVDQLLQSGLSAGASDWHLDEGKQPAWRVEGQFTILRSSPVLTGEDLRAVIDAIGTGTARTADGTFRHHGHLFRISFGPTRDGLSAVLRHVDATLPTLDELQTPKRYVQLLDEREGLLLLSGPTGCGKSTTLHASIAYLNGRAQGGTITILGDPIEYYHVDQECRIRHREFGRDFTSWPEVLAGTLRQDPDVICVSELRDAATMRLALAAAETGHLVLGTLHNGSAKDAVGRIVESSPEQDWDQQRALFSKAMRGVLAQQLIPTPSGRRVAAFELLVNTEGVSNLIRDCRFKQIDDEILRGHQHGMIAMDDSLARLVETGRITKSVALKHARYPAALEKNLVRL